MFYDFTITIPTDATKAKPEVKEINLTYGVVHKVTVSFWPGPHGLAHLIIKQYDHQVLPSNIDESFHYDNYTHVMEERIELFDAPYELKLIGWGVGCKYPHQVKVGIGILPPECFPEYQKADTRLAKLLKLIGVK
uniref:Uncharacterized protein n=1 Tax=viral metagenome TaxID=1070528 RepID=A0A6H1ZT83_9ZZZZ